MENIKQLAKLQEKLRCIDKLSNYMQKIDDKKTKNDIAYLIHCIVESDYIDTTLAREITSYSLLTNADMFMSVPNN